MARSPNGCGTHSVADPMVWGLWLQAVLGISFHNVAMPQWLRVSQIVLPSSGGDQLHLRFHLGGCQHFGSADLFWAVTDSVEPNALSDTWVKMAIGQEIDITHMVVGKPFSIRIRIYERGRCYMPLLL